MRRQKWPLVRWSIGKMITDRLPNLSFLNKFRQGLRLEHVLIKTYFDPSRFNIDLKRVLGIVECILPPAALRCAPCYRNRPIAAARCIRRLVRTIASSAALR